MGARGKRAEDNRHVAYIMKQELEIIEKTKEKEKMKEEMYKKNVVLVCNF